MSQQRDLLEVTDVTDEERTTLVQLLQKHSQEEVRSDEVRSVVGIAVGAAVTWILNHREDIKKALALAEDLIAWVKKWRGRRSVEGASARQESSPAHAADEQPRIILVLAGQGPKDITAATDEQIRSYFRKNPIAP